MRYQAQLNNVMIDNRPVDYYSDKLESVKDWAKRIIARHGGEVHVFEVKVELVEVIKSEEKT